MSYPYENDRQQNPQQTETDELLRLRAARDVAVQAAREAVRDTTRLTRLLSILNDSGPLNLVLDRVLSTISELFLADIVVLLDPVGTGTFSPLAAIGLPEDILQLPFSDEEGSYTKLLRRTGVPILIDNAVSDPKIDFQISEQGAEAVVMLPVDGSDTTRGVLILARCRPDPFADDDVGLLSTMAYRIGRTLAEAQRSVQFEKIIQSGREIGRHLDFATITAEAVRMSPVIVCADASVLILSDPGGEVYCAAQTGLHSSCTPALCKLAEYLITSSLLGKSEPYSTADISAGIGDYAFNFNEMCPVKALLAIPIHRQDRVHGILFVVRFSAIAFNTSASQVAAIYADQISAALENSRLYQAVHNELIQRKKLEDEQRKWERQQQQLQKTESLHRMAGAIAHNFNNSLCAVMGNLELALMDSSFGSSVDVLNQAMKASRRAAEVSSLMLTYLGQSVASYTPADLSEICRKSMTLLKVATSQGTTFKVDLPSTGPIINADVSQIQQVLTNLVINAWESTNKSEGTVNLSVRSTTLEDILGGHRFPVDWQPQDKIYACIEVSDTGCGISEQDIDKLFDPFFSSKFTGRGLGLAVVLGIVKAHGGGVVVESQTGEGSIFRVLLPISGKTVSRQPEKIIPPLEIKEGDRVLLVEDDEIMRSMAETMLTRLGFEVFTAKDGIEAVEMFQKQKDEIRVVVTDLSMPRMDGWETLSALRRIRPDIPVVLSSGYDEVQVINNDHPERPNVFLHKPYQKATLKEALSKAMNE